MVSNKAHWSVHFNIWLKHIKHDIEKGLYNQEYKWHNIIATTNGTGEMIRFTQGSQVETVSALKLGSEEKNYTDNRLKNYLTVAGIKSTMEQKSIKGNKATIKKGDTMNTNKIVNEATNTIKTVGAEIQASAITAAKMEAGETILLSLRNLVMQRAGFMTKVKFKFAPVLLDVAVTVGADVLVTEIMPNKKSAKLACECLNLAMTKEVIHLIPLQEFTNALTGGEAFQKVKNILSDND